MTNETTVAATEPSTLEKLARNLMGAAEYVDTAMENLHCRLNAMLEAQHGLTQYLVAENADLKRQLEDAI